MVVTLTSGNSLMVQRVISYGDIAIVIAVIALIVVILFALWMLVPVMRAK
jgi:hypothetical protein